MNKIEALEVDDLDVEDLDSDGLPEPIGVDTFLNNLPKLPPELIEGLIYRCCFQHANACL